MSFILDALKKSEAERQRQAGPALLEMRVVRPQRRIPVWLVVVGGALIVLNLAGMLWLFLRPAARTAAPPAVAAAPVATPAPAPAAVATNANGTPLLAPGERIIGPGSAPAEVPPLANEPPNAQPAPEPGDTDVNPADYVPAAPAARGPRDTGLRSYSEVSNQVPAMRLDLHVYDPAPAQRYAFINMKKVREGDATPDGSRVVEITRDGVVLDYRSTVFLLTSDSSAPAGSAAR